MSEVSTYLAALVRAVPPSVQNSSPTCVPPAAVQETLKTAFPITRKSKMQRKGARARRTGIWEIRRGRGEAASVQQIFPHGFIIGAQADVAKFGNVPFAVSIQYVGE